MSESDFYCPDCKFILDETSHLINKIGLDHAEKIAKKYRIGFSVDEVLKNLGLN